MSEIDGGKRAVAGIYWVRVRGAFVTWLKILLFELSCNAIYQRSQSW